MTVLTSLCIIQSIEVAAYKAKRCKQSVGQVLLHDLAPETQQLLQKLHGCGNIAVYELDTVCFARLADLAPESQIAVSAVGCDAFSICRQSILSALPIVHSTAAIQAAVLHSLIHC